MTSYYNNIYTSLRSAMIDRDMGDKPEDAVLVDLVSAQIALRKEMPSAAVLIAYSMLYFPGWLESAKPEVAKPATGKPVEAFIGGVENIQYPLLFNIHTAMITLAIGVYAKFWTIQYSHVLNTVMVNPNMASPLVLKTRELIMENKLRYPEARNVFIELMQQEEYSGDITFADDFVANAAFIQEANVTVESTLEDVKEQVQAVDLSKYFETIQS